MIGGTMGEGQNRKKVRIKHAVGGIVYFAAIACGAFLMIRYVGQRIVVDGTSMVPTLNDGDNLFIDKLSYRFCDPERFDIIVFPHESNGKTVYFIKRIVGIPGDTVQIINGRLYINGCELAEPMETDTMLSAGIAGEVITLGKNEYFVLGDNRNHSNDSRSPDVGIITKDRIVGKALLRIWPLSEIAKL